MSNNYRYMTPISYKDGAGKKKSKQLFFELTPVQLADWVIDNPFEANELRASMLEMENIEQDNPRDLTQDEILMMLGVIRILSNISAGRPTDDDEYFIKDPNWVHSYAYQAFREMLFTRPAEMVQFLKTLMTNESLNQFNTALEKVNDEATAEKVSETAVTKPSDLPDKPASEMTEAELREFVENSRS